MRDLEISHTKILEFIPRHILHSYHSFHLIFWKRDIEIPSPSAFFNSASGAR